MPDSHLLPHQRPDIVQSERRRHLLRPANEPHRFAALSFRPSAIRLLRNGIAGHHGPASASAQPHPLRILQLEHDVPARLKSLLDIQTSWI